MKSFFTIILSLSAAILVAQNPHCYSDEYRKQQLLEDPTVKEKILEAEAKYQAYVNSKSETKLVGDDEIILIPVVVHIVYNVTAENISDEQVYSQIEVLNEDFRRLNADASETPSEFLDVASDAKIEFQLAMFDEDGMPTTGITRTETDISSWNYFTSSSSANYAENIKDSDDGGIDGWDRDCYLNIWVGDLGSSLLGYSSFVGGASSKDGVVIHYKYFGRDGSAFAPFDNGRTASHEIGHWLGLYHVWGDDGSSCTGSDLVADTPNQTSETYGCPSFPKTDACSPVSPGIMFMNFMDYTNDDCMNLFTEGQKSRMRDIINSNREELLTCTAAWTNISAEIEKDWMHFSIEPNPATNYVEIHFQSLDVNAIEIEIVNMQGQIIASKSSAVALNHVVHFNSSNFANNMYVVKIYDGEKYYTKQLSIVH